jgi:hypothetical protein
MSARTSLRFGFVAACWLATIGAAFAQSAPANLPAQTVFGRLGQPGDTGPGQAIPFSALPFAPTGIQSPNTVFAGPSSGGAASPTFRSIVGADLPAPGPSSLGGVDAITCASHQWLNQISTLGVPVCFQPAIGDISGTGTAAAQNIGTSGANVPLLNGANTWSAPLTFSAVLNFSSGQISISGISTPLMNFVSTLTANVAQFFSDGTNWQIATQGVGNWFEVNLTNGQTQVLPAIASTSKSTGALLVSGTNAGIGVAGAIWAGTYIDITPTVVASLPTCNSALDGARAYVTNNATAVSFGGAVTTGGHHAQPGLLRRIVVNMEAGVAI